LVTTSVAPIFPAGSVSSAARIIGTAPLPAAITCTLPASDHSPL
jgi:hypothetical protein